jgi:hypothetical protein
LSLFEGVASKGCTKSFHVAVREERRRSLIITLTTGIKQKLRRWWCV